MTERRRLRMPITGLLLLFLVISISVSAGLLWLLFGPSQDYTTNAAIEETHEVVRGTGNAALGIPMFTRNIENIESILDSLVNSGVVASVAVYDSNKKLLAFRENESQPLEKGIKILTKKEEIYTEVVSLDPLMEEEGLERTFVGTVEYKLTPYPLLEAQRQYKQGIYATLAILVTALAILGMYFYHALQKSASNILGGIKLVKAGAKGVTIKEDGFIDEFCQIADGFNEMAGSVDNITGQLESKATELEAKAYEANHSKEESVRNQRDKEALYEFADRELRHRMIEMETFVEALFVKSDYGKKLTSETDYRELKRFSTDLLQTMDGILGDLSKSSKENVVYSKTNIEEFFEELSGYYAERFSRREFSFSVSGATASPYLIKMAREKIELTVQKLLDNAEKYCKEGTVDLSWRVGEEGDTTNLYITLRDTSTVFTEEEAANVFERQFHLGNSNDGDRKGFGLYIARNTVEALEGSISIDSREGFGTIIDVAIPVVLTNELAPHKEQPAADKTALVLCCSMEVDNQFSEILPKLGFAPPRIDDSLVDGSLQLRRNHYDVVFIDEAAYEDEYEDLQDVMKDYGKGTRIVLVGQRYQAKLGVEALPADFDDKDVMRMMNKSISTENVVSLAFNRDKK